MKSSERASRSGDAEDDIFRRRVSPPGQPPGDTGPCNPNDEPGPSRGLSPEAYKTIENFAFARARCWPYEVREDVHAEALLRCLQDPDYRLILPYRQENYGTPAYKLAEACISKNINSSYDYVVQRNRKWETEALDGAPIAADVPADDRDLTIDLANALNKLSDTERICITQLFKDGLTLKEFASQNGLTYEVARGIRDRALARLKRALRTYEQERDAPQE